jgi:chromosome segregation ATPase
MAFTSRQYYRCRCIVCIPRRSELHSKEQQVVTVDERLDRIDKHLARWDSRFDILERADRESEARFDALERNVIEFRSRFDVLERADMELRGLIVHLRDSVGGMFEAMQAQNMEGFANLQARFTRLEDRFDKLEARLSDF